MVDTTDRPRDIAAFPQSLASDLRRPLEQMRTNMQLLLGLKGAGDWAAITERRAAALGVTTGVGGGAAPTAPVDEAPDLTPPPAVTGLAVSAGISYVYVEWDVPGYLQGHGHAATNIYAAQREPTDPSVPTFADAVLVHRAVGSMVFAAVPSEPNSRWHVWAKWETVDGVKSSSPAGGTNGQVATTGQDVSQLLAVLTGRITSSQLFEDLADRIDLVDGGTSLPGSVNARVDAEATARIAADGALSTSITSVLAVANAAAAAVVTEQSARADGDAANASAITVVQARLNTGGGGPNKARNPGFVQHNGTLPTGWNVYNNDGGAVPTSSTIVTGPDGYNAARITWTGVNASTKGIYQIPLGSPTKAGGWYVYACRVATSNAAMLGRHVTMARTDQAFTEYEVLRDPALTAEFQWYVARGRKAVDSPEVYVSVAPGTNVANGAYDIAQIVVHEGTEFQGFSTELSAAIEQEATARANADGTLFAQYTVKVDVNGYVSGFGLASTSNGAAPSSSFIIRANNFAVASPSGPGVPAIVPFVVNTTPVVENGVTVPAGVYMDGAYIRNLNAAIARLGAAWIDDAKIASVSAAKLSAGYLTVGSWMASTGFASGSAGWAVWGNGNSEFNNIVARGTVYAAAGAIGGISIDAGGVQSSNYTAGAGGAGFRIQSDGNAVFNAGVIRGKLVASQIDVLGNANLGAAIVQTANIADANITTLKVAGNSITAPAGAKLAADTTVGTGSYTTYLSVTVDPGGNPVWVTGTVHVKINTGLSGDVRLLLQLANGSGFQHVAAFNTLWYDPASIQYQILPITFYDASTATGPRTYQFRMVCTHASAAVAQVDGTTLFAVGLKR